LATGSRLIGGLLLLLLLLNGGEESKQHGCFLVSVGW
jgi:hypothetical protein